MALTVRTTEQENNMIDVAAKQLGTNTASKTLISACDQFLKQRDEILQLTKELAGVRRQLERRTNVVESFQKSFKDLMECK